MKTNKTLRAVLASAVLMMVMVGLMAQPAAAESAGNDTNAAARLLELANRDRAQAGLAPLAARGDVISVAASWSASMADTQVLAHNDAYFSADSKRRLGAKSLGENVARNGSVDDAHARLMASPGHRANLMSGTFSVVGMAVYRDGTGTYWVTQSFLQPAAAPAPAPAPAAPKAAPAPAAPKAASAAAPVKASAAPVKAAAPAPAEAAPAPEASVDLADAELISAPTLGRAGWNGSPSAPIAAGGTQMAIGTGHMLLAAACVNALAALAAAAAWRRRQAA